MTITATHAPFLQTAAQLIILPMNVDGTVGYGVLARIKSMYPAHYEAYRTACRDGIVPGEVLLTKIPKERFGLGIASNQSPNYIASLIVTHHAHDHIVASTFKLCLDKLKPQLFELMRYQGLRRAALYASPLIRKLDDLPTLTVDELWTCLQDLELPKFGLEVHFDRQVDIDALSSWGG